MCKKLNDNELSNVSGGTGNGGAIYNTGDTVVFKKAKYASGGGFQTFTNEYEAAEGVITEVNIIPSTGMYEFVITEANGTVNYVPENLIIGVK